MEWEQITDRWATMTHRLRGGIPAGAEGNTGRAQHGIGPPRDTASDVQGQMSVRLIANDRIQPSRQ
jgi:hypothetical protein